MDFLVIMLIIVLAVVLADVISHFFPAIPAPIMQIGLGAAISCIPMAAHFEIEHHYSFHRSACIFRRYGDQPQAALEE